MVRVCVCARLRLWAVPQALLTKLYWWTPGNFKGGGCAGVNIEFGGLLDAFGLATVLPGLIQDWVRAVLWSLASDWLT